MQFTQSLMPQVIIISRPWVAQSDGQLVAVVREQHPPGTLALAPYEERERERSDAKEEEIYSPSIQRRDLRILGKAMWTFGHPPAS